MALIALAGYYGYREVNPITGEKPEFLSSHPDYGNREETIKAVIAERYPNGIPSQLTRGRRQVTNR